VASAHRLGMIPHSKSHRLSLDSMQPILLLGQDFGKAAPGSSNRVDIVRKSRNPNKRPEYSALREAHPIFLHWCFS